MRYMRAIIYCTGKKEKNSFTKKVRSNQNTTYTQWIAFDKFKNHQEALNYYKLLYETNYCKVHKVELLEDAQDTQLRKEKEEELRLQEIESIRDYIYKEDEKS